MVFSLLGWCIVDVLLYCIYFTWLKKFHAPDIIAFRQQTLKLLVINDLV